MEEIKNKDNREAILSCALELFSDKGYDAVGVQEIVNQAGITKPTLYHYFGNKEGLLFELLNTKHENMLRRIEKVARYEGDLPLTMYRLTEAYFSYARENKRFYRLFMSMQFYPPQSEAFNIAKPLIDKEIKVLSELFLNAAKDHGNMRGRQYTYAVTYLGMVNSYIQIHRDEEDKNHGEMIVKAIQQFMHGIYS